jgi:hypothetical protein
VKFAIAMLGLFKEGGTSEVVRALGRHEEFTLFAVVAIAGQAENPDLELWELAKGVNGWGRIYCVERLAGTTNTAIKAWLLRAGFRNSVMDEYIAHLAADTGDLVDELRQEHPDDALLAGAGGMLSAMANGAPGPGMGAMPPAARPPSSTWGTWPAGRERSITCSPSSPCTGTPAPARARSIWPGRDGRPSAARRSPRLLAGSLTGRSGAS